MTQNSSTHKLRLHPAWLMPVTLVAGLAASGPLAGWILASNGRKRLGALVGGGGFFLGAGLLAGMFAWNVEWRWVGLALTSVHFFLGGALYFLLNELLPPSPAAEGDGGLQDAKSGEPCGRPEESHADGGARENAGSWRHMAAGAIGGAMVTGMVGSVCAVFYLLIVDSLFSTWLPVAFADDYALWRVLFFGVFFTLAGGLAGAVGGRTRPNASPAQFVGWCLVLVYAFLAWTMASELTIALPGFQAGPATGKGWRDIYSIWFLGGFCIGIPWSVFFFFFITGPGALRQKLARGAAVAGFGLTTAVTLAVTFGYAAEAYLALGLNFERRAHITKALWCYENGLRKMPEDHVASFLQYRAALIYHKLKKPEKAEQGFTRLVAKYNANADLEKKAGRFLDSLRRSGGKKRVVLPGVETRTEYKSAYCVPNSLALTMRYWGADVDARDIGRKITGLSGGTFAVNQAWYALQNGFHHDFLPMAGVEDIKRCIDAGFPVMVYVPSHVLVIFGYDEALETFVTYDTSTADLWSEYIQKDFIKAWKKAAATVILAYPPEKRELLPPDVAQRLTAFSDNYLHYELYGLDAPSIGVSVPHLMAAAGETGEFFLPVTIMYSRFPGLRRELEERFDPETVMKSITQYFGEDFDEGEHLYGQHHDEDSVRSDWALRSSIFYLIGNKRFDIVESLITRIDQEGAVSGRMIGNLGMIDLVSGDFDRGLDRIQRAFKQSGDQDWGFYLALARKMSGNERDAVRLLVQSVESSAGRFRRGARTAPSLTDGRRSTRLGLDDYGFPSLALANKILLEIGAFGESREALINAWEPWVHTMPFDAPVAGALARLYEQELRGLDPDKDAAQVQRLSAKLSLARRRAQSYAMEGFGKPM